ncbi:MAG TPA: sugar phosphate nucleotidyltransferase [Patescibacteria group bacterium]|nr:sugar phosphate nucleotidyltransferase [Patescibacteria group bacterium]
MSKIRKAVIPAAGFGTRFLPQTKAMPKEMLPIVDKPIIQYIVEELVDAGITDIILVTGYHKRTIEDHFDAANLDLIENLRMGGEKKRPLLEQIEQISTMANFIYVRQKGPYGNGTPLLNVRHIVGNEPFIYTFSDDFISAEPKSRFKQMIDIYEEFGCSVLSSIRAKKDEDYDRYGFAGGEEIRPGLIDAGVIIEKPGKENAPSNLANVSSTLLTPEIFNYLDRASENLKEGEELYYNDALKLMLEEGHKVIAAEIENGKYYDTGNKLEYMKTAVEFALKHADISGEFKQFLRDLNLD